MHSTPTRMRAPARTAARSIPARSRRPDGSRSDLMSHFIRTEADLDAAMAALIKADSRFAPAFTLAGRPPLRKRADGFAGLASIVVSQQLSTASAKAILGRLEA